MKAYSIIWRISHNNDTASTIETFTEHDESRLWVEGSATYVHPATGSSYAIDLPVHPIIVS